MGHAGLAALAAFEIVTDLADLVEHVHLGAEEEVVVWGEDDARAAGLDGGDEIEWEALEGVDVDDVGAEGAQEIEDEGGEAWRGDLGVWGGEVLVACAEDGAVEDGEAGDAAPDLGGLDSGDGEQGVVDAAAEEGDEVAPLSEFAGEFGDIEVVSRAFAFLEGEACPPEHGDSEWRRVRLCGV